MPLNDAIASASTIRVAARASPRTALFDGLDLLEHARAPFRLELLGDLREHRRAERVDVRHDHRHAGRLELIDERALLLRELLVLPRDAGLDRVAYDLAIRRRETLPERFVHDDEP